MIRERVRTRKVGDAVSFEPAGLASAKSLDGSAAVIQLGDCCDDLLIAAARRAKAVLVSPQVLARGGTVCRLAHRIDESVDAVARELDLLATDRARARQLGLTAAETLHATLPTWDAVASQLLQ